MRKRAPAKVNYGGQIRPRFVQRGHQTQLASTRRATNAFELVPYNAPLPNFTLPQGINLYFGRNAEYGFAQYDPNLHGFNIPNAINVPQIPIVTTRSTIHYDPGIQPLTNLPEIVNTLATPSYQRAARRIGMRGLNFDATRVQARWRIFGDRQWAFTPLVPFHQLTNAIQQTLDFFDIQKGLSGGDVSRAHPYETQFLKSVLIKDKIIDRFRTYFGGKKRKK